MPIGVSIHIGLNELDAGHYRGRFPLRGCLGDAEAMEELARDAGFEPRRLTGPAATADAVLAAVREAGERVGSDGILLLTFSGHGGRVPDTSGDELDGSDETWCLYDRELLDDELHDAWLAFPPGARILVVSDSCYSGDVTRPGEASRYRRRPSGSAQGIRAIGAEAAADVYQRNASLYDAVRQRVRRRVRRAPVSARVLLLSAAADNETAADGESNGLFTAALLEAWNGGKFQGDYADLHRAVFKCVGHRQHPVLLPLSRPSFVSERPFTI